MISKMRHGAKNRSIFFNLTILLGLNYMTSANIAEAVIQVNPMGDMTWDLQTIKVVDTSLIAQYVPPKSQPLYTSNGEPGDPLKFNSGLFLGAGLGFGQSRASGGHPTAAYGGNGEIGYVAGTGSWSRFETGLEAFAGKTGHSKADITVLGLLAKIGYGYSLGNKFFGITKVGLGLLQADYSASDAAGMEINSKGGSVGTVWQLAYLISMPMGNYMSMVSGIKWTHMSFVVGDVVVGPESTGTVIDIDKNMSINTPEVQIGFRLGI